jgi:Flp pilus assembly protein TadG
MRKFFRSLRSDQSGLAVVEFAVSLPFFMGLTVAGIETANYANIVMQLNQITIHTADSAARMGEGNQLAVKQIREIHVNDVFAGTAREGETLLLSGRHAYTSPTDGTVALRGNAKIILSSLEPTNPFSTTTPRYRIRWQRCMGLASFYTSNYGTTATSTSITAMGPTGRQIVAPSDGAVMFVETQYWFKPIIVGGFARLTDHTISQTASMVVRDQRNYRLATGEESTPITNPENVAVSTCA